MAPVGTWRVVWSEPGAGSPRSRLVSGTDDADSIVGIQATDRCFLVDQGILSTAETPTVGLEALNADGDWAPVELDQPLTDLRESDTVLNDEGGHGSVGMGRAAAPGAASLAGANRPPDHRRMAGEARP
jgi:hypothetical protein